MVSRLTNIGEDYRNLYSFSRDARYRGVAYTSHRVDEIKSGPFHRVKAEILALLPS